MNGAPTLPGNPYQKFRHKIVNWATTSLLIFGTNGCQSEGKTHADTGASFSQKCKKPTR